MALTEEQRAKLNAKAAMKAAQRAEAEVVNDYNEPYEGKVMGVVPYMNNGPQKICPNCGQYVDADSIVCSFCGYRFVNVQPGGLMQYPNGYRQQYSGQPVSYINIVNQQPVEPVKQHISGLGLAGMICSVIGLFILPWILSTLGVIFGAIGWYQAKTYPEKYSGVGFGITGVVLGTCSLIYKIYLLVSVMNYLGNLFA